jgi:hypothetical protein
VVTAPEEAVIAEVPIVPEMAVESPAWLLGAKDVVVVADTAPEAVKLLAGETVDV